MQLAQMTKINIYLKEAWGWVTLWLPAYKYNNLYMRAVYIEVYLWRPHPHLSPAFPYSLSLETFQTEKLSLRPSRFHLHLDIGMTSRYLHHPEGQPIASTSYLPPPTQQADPIPIFDLTGQILKQHDQACGGGFADVYKALWMNENVCSKILTL